MNTVWQSLVLQAGVRHGGRRAWRRSWFSQPHLMLALLVGLSAAFLLSRAEAASVSYSYDDFNRLTSASYDNGRLIINYAYDPAGNITSVETIGSDELPPLLTIGVPTDGQVLQQAVLIASGTATDAGRGSNGVASVTVNGIAATGGAAIGDGIANWTANVGASLAVGTNSFTVVATDDSPLANEVSQTVSVVYLPLIADMQPNGLPDSWESQYGISDPADDSDVDGISAIDEFKAGTSPANTADRPEGANGVNYVLLRDQFDDNRYDDRWYLGALDVDADYTLIESGSALQTTLSRPLSGCKALRTQGFSSVDAVNTVLRAALELNGTGQAGIGLMQNEDASNRVEIRIDGDTAPYLLLRSVEAGVITDTPVVLSAAYAGSVDIRLIKRADNYTVFVGVERLADVSNAGLGDVALRPYLLAESCEDDALGVNFSTDRLELLLDRDADGLADTHEDLNANGVVDAGESDPLSADMDADTIPDGFDNCLAAANPTQLDTDGDGYGNHCDADLNNNGFVNFIDLGLFRQRFGTNDPDADLNGNGFVNFIDLGLFRQQFGQAPGPSGTQLP